MKTLTITLRADEVSELNKILDNLKKSTHYTDRQDVVEDVNRVSEILFGGVSQ